MKSFIKLFLILITFVVFIFAWATQQLGTTRIQILIIILVAVTLAAFLAMNLLDHREQRRKRMERESRTSDEEVRESGSGQKRSDTSFALREKKSGLTWGGGNIKASEATRGTKRKFLGR